MKLKLAIKRIIFSLNSLDDIALDPIKYTIQGLRYRELSSIHARVKRLIELRNKTNTSLYPSRSHQKSILSNMHVLLCSFRNHFSSRYHISYLAFNLHITNDR